MGIFSIFTFWKKKKLPELPEDNPPLEGPVSYPQQFQNYSERPPFQYPEPRFEPQIQQSTISPEFQVISSKLDVLNAKIEVLNERLSNIEKNLNNARVRW